MTTLDEAVDGFTRAYVNTLLAAEGGNVTRCAKRAGRTRAGFDRLLRKLGVSAKSYRPVCSCGEHLGYDWCRVHDLK